MGDLHLTVTCGHGSRPQPDGPGMTQHSGWAHASEEPHTIGIAPVWMTDMPVGQYRPPPPRKIKGVAAPTRDADPDYRPGGGVWRPL